MVNFSKLEAKVADLIEDAFLYSRYLLVPLYFGLLYQIVVIGVDFYKVQFGVISEEVLTTHTLVVLETVDRIMIASLVWLVSVGSYYVFVHKRGSDKQRPRGLEHISSGILKEKMAGSLIGVSSVYFLQLFLHLSDPTFVINWHFGAQVVMHLLFIAGLLAFCKTNAAPHHNHSEEEKKRDEVSESNSIS